jgi:hypothetical protein
MDIATFRGTGSAEIHVWRKRELCVASKTTQQPSFSSPFFCVPRAENGRTLDRLQDFFTPEEKLRFAQDPEHYIDFRHELEHKLKYGDIPAMMKITLEYGLLLIVASPHFFS